jgi:hypothetical protein
MNAFEQIFGGYIASQIRHHGANPASDWRILERLLISCLNSYGVHIINEAGMPTVEVVRFQEPEEVVTARISLEHLARFLARELAP